MSVPPPETHYTLRSVQKMLGLSWRTIASLIDHGFVTPTRGSRNGYRFSFQDVVLLRMAHALRSARIPPRRMLQSLQQLRAKLPERTPLSAVRIQAVGNDVVVRDAGEHWETPSGQLLLDFEVDARAGTVSPLRSPGAMAGEGVYTDTVAVTRKFNAASALEEQGRIAEAEEAYRSILLTHPEHAESYLNLSALLCDSERYEEGAELLHQAVARCSDSPLLHFNHAVALEDLDRRTEAVASYRRCLAADPDFVDAHHNLAMLLDKLGDARGALRHYSAVRRLSAAD